MKYDSKSYRKQRLIGFTAVLTMLLALMLSPVRAYALDNDQDIENNYTDYENNCGTIINNYGNIGNHRMSLIENNYGNIDNMAGGIDHMYSGVITTNSGEINEFLGGVITNNYGTIHSMDPVNAIVVNNYGGYLPAGCEATNQYYRFEFIPTICGDHLAVNVAFTGFTESYVNSGYGYGHLKHEESGTVTLTAVAGYSLSGPEVTTPVSAGSYDYTVTKNGDSYVIGISNMTGNTEVFLDDLGLTLCKEGNPVQVVELNISTNADSIMILGNDVADVSVISFTSTDNIINRVEYDGWDSNTDTKFMRYKAYYYCLNGYTNAGYNLHDMIQYVRVDGELITSPYISIRPDRISITVMREAGNPRLQNNGQSYKKSSQKGSSLSDHTHSFSWVVTKYPTSTSDGEEAYMCSCGEIAQISTLPAISAFEEETINKIKNAPANGVIEVETKLFNSFGIGVRDALAARPDVTLKVKFLSEGYRGQLVKVTIPTGIDRYALWDKDGWLGLCRAGSTLGYDKD